ncbi:uncharacterized protein [Patagioenas fasciata]|uniref:uncharacterized protein n=1 Tax=Patagioenas fasciata TaxID=372321 RepID=UPI003A9993A1
MAPLSCGSISVLFRGVFNLGCSVDPFCSRWPTIAWKQQKLFAPAERIERTSRWRMLKTPGSLMEAALHKARGLKGATYGAPSFATRTPNHRDNVAVQLLRTVCVSGRVTSFVLFVCFSLEMKVRCPEFHVPCGPCWAESPPHARGRFPRAAAASAAPWGSSDVLLAEPAPTNSGHVEAPQWVFLEIPRSLCFIILTTYLL